MILGRRTVYQGGDAETDLVFGKARIRLARPLDPESLLEDPEVLEWNRRDDYMPYWASLWPGSFLLAEAIARRGAVTNASCALEIGCGLGLAGLVALWLGHEVRFTDYDEAPLEYVRRSIAASGLGSRPHSLGSLDWRRPEPVRYDLILAADVLYERQMPAQIADLADAMLAQSGELWAATPHRAAAEGVEAIWRQRGLIAECEEIEAAGDDGKLHRGRVWRARRGG